MKHNLETLKQAFHNYNKNGSFENFQKVIREFRGFEKELREIRDSNRNLALDKGHDLVPNLIKEILGEE